MPTGKLLTLVLTDVAQICTWVRVAGFLNLILADFLTAVYNYLNVCIKIVFQKRL